MITEKEMLGKAQPRKNELHYTCTYTYLFSQQYGVRGSARKKDGNMVANKSNSSKEQAYISCFG